MSKKLRIYIDTSVIGGCFDDEFKKASNNLFKSFDRELSLPVISEVVVAEIEKAPEKVKKKLGQIRNIEIIAISEEMKELAEKYMAQKIVSAQYAGDALHIAAATITKADVLVSWNFKHIVNLKKIHAFNGVNKQEGYAILEIRTPEEVIENE